MSILKVQELQHTNATSAMTIDTAGRILTPARPTLFADMHNGSSAAYDTIQNMAVVPYRRVISGSGITLSTGAFTIPITGFYQVNATILNNNLEDLELALTIGSDYAGGIVLRSFSNDDNRFVNLHMALQLSANDVCRIVNSSGGARGFHRNTNATDRYSALSVYLIG